MSFSKNDIQSATELINQNPINYERLDEVKIRRFRLSDLQINARNAVHWEKKGLFLNKKEEGKWQFLNLSELTWILIVKKLRDYNFKLEIIKDLKDDFLNHKIGINAEKKEELKNTLRKLHDSNIEKILSTPAFDEFILNMDLTILELIIMDIIHLRNHYRLLFNINGETLLIKEGVEDQVLSGRLEEFRAESHFSLNINELLAEILSKIDLTIAHGSYQMISKEERTILEMLRNEDFYVIEIKKNSKTKKLETIKCQEIGKLDTQKRICELIIQNSYQNINIVTQSGKVSHFTNTFTYKFDTE